LGLRFGVEVWGLGFGGLEFVVWSSGVRFGIQGLGAGAYVAERVIRTGVKYASARVVLFTCDAFRI
jgi:hypothetical protein